MTYDNYRHWVKHRILIHSTPREGGCIEYADGKTKHKYGLVSITFNSVRKSVPAHRALWMAENDRMDLARGIYIRHKCDNPKCVNIEHLEEGTPKDNNADCIERGRRARKHKLHTRLRRLSDDNILAIKASTEKACHVCSKFKISNSYLSKLRNNRAKTLVSLAI